MPRKSKVTRGLSGAGYPRAQVQQFPHANYGVNAADVPTYIEPFTAYRAWNWTEDGVTSLNGVIWTPKVAFEATCRIGYLILSKEAHPTPNEECSCGMYAGINMQHLIDIGYIERGLHGEVQLWGRLMRHTLGWRAQYAYPKNFVVPRNMLPFEMKTFQRRMEVLIAFDVDIYLQTEKEPHVGQVNLPLWVKDYGYSQVGLDYVITERAQWKPPQVDGIKVGDRIAVLHPAGGIGIVKQADADAIYYNLFGISNHKIRQRDVRWNDKNWRWETSSLGSISGK